MAWYSKEFRRSFVPLIVYQPKPKPHLKPDVTTRRVFLCPAT